MRLSLVKHIINVDKCSKCVRQKKTMTYHADGLKEIGAAPAGQARTFCDPVYSTSIPGQRRTNITSRA